MEPEDAEKITPIGCIPPFSRQSNRPGIGAKFADDIAAALIEHGHGTLDSIPVYLEHGRNSRRPLGRYLRNRIRAGLAIPKEEATAYGIAKLNAKLSPLRQIALRAPAGSNRQWVFREELVKAFDNKRLQIQTKRKIFKQRKKL